MELNFIVQTHRLELAGLPTGLHLIVSFFFEGVEHREILIKVNLKASIISAIISYHNNNQNQLMETLLIEYNEIILIASRTVILSISLDRLTPYDSASNKIMLALSIATILILTSTTATSQTFTFLLNLICLQIIILGILNFLKLSFLMVIFLVAINISGLAYSIIKQYYKQLYQEAETSAMFLSVVLILAAMWIFNLVANVYKLSMKDRRKMFHFFPILLFPWLWYLNSFFFMLMLGGVFYIFFQIQLVRYLAQFQCFLADQLLCLVPIIPWMQAFNNQREKYFWFTHLFLFLGFILPYLYYKDQIQANIGLILSFGDAMAALLGKKYGKMHMAGASPKTVFGFTAFTISVTAGQLFLGFNRSYVFIVLASVCCGITEVYSGDLDNISVVMVYILIDILL